MILLDFILAAVLLVWGSRQVRDGARAAAMPWVQRVLRRPMAFTQPASFALALVFGAHLGAGVAILVLVVAPTWCLNALTISGAVTMLGSKPSPVRDGARALFGGGLVLLSLRMIELGANATFSGPFFSLLAGELSQDPLLAVAVGVVAVMCLQSHFATVLVLAGTWASWLHPEAAVAALAGVHSGGAVLAYWKGEKNSKKHLVKAAHACVTLMTCAAMVLSRGELAALLAGPPALAILQLHVLSLALGAALSLPFATGLLRLVGSLMAAQEKGSPSQATRLRSRDLDDPSLALAAALREVMRMADLVENMLRSMKAVFLQGDLVAAQAIRDAELRVNAIYLSLKQYLAQIPRQSLSAGELDRWEELLAFLTASEQVADRVVRVLDELERKKPPGGSVYPVEAEGEVLALLGQLEMNMRLGASVCMDRRVDAARELSTSMDSFRNLEQSYRSAHVERLVAGDAGSAAISALHFNLMADMLDMNDQICTFARRVVAIHIAASRGSESRAVTRAPILQQPIF